jgi:hypothetical protein
MELRNLSCNKGEYFPMIKRIFPYERVAVIFERSLSSAK